MGFSWTFLMIGPKANDLEKNHEPVKLVYKTKKALCQVQPLTGKKRDRRGVIIGNNTNG
jgi:hypothetical protein